MESSRRSPVNLKWVYFPGLNEVALNGQSTFPSRTIKLPRSVLTKLNPPSVVTKSCDQYLVYRFGGLPVSGFVLIHVDLSSTWFGE
jgi:hypothetical protein